jgi:hypothetical protein
VACSQGVTCSLVSSVTCSQVSSVTCSLVSSTPSTPLTLLHSLYCTRYSMRRDELASL